MPRVTTTGVLAHSSELQKGVNAIGKLVQALGLLATARLHSGSFYSITRIYGVVADNVVPDAAEATLVFRIAPQDRAEYTLELGRLLAGLAEVVEVLRIESVSCPVPPALSFLQVAGTVKYCTVAGILGPMSRFVTDAQLAAYAGVAPLEASSASTSRHWLNRGGNRRLNAILYRIVLTQSRYSAQAKAYIQKCMSEGKTRREAVRALKRHIVRTIWRLWRECKINKHEAALSFAA